MKVTEVVRTLLWGGVETVVVERRALLYCSTTSTFYPASGRTNVGNPHYFTFVDGVPRWENGRIPYEPDLRAAGIDAVPGYDATRTAELREAQVAESIRCYRAQGPRKLGDEERHEMRAAFGSGQVVVDVLTGQRFRT